MNCSTRCVCVCYPLVSAVVNSLLTCLSHQKPIYNFDTRDCNIMKLKVPAVKFAIGNESRKSQHHHVTNADTDTEGEEPQGEGLHRRAQHKGEASSRHEEATNTSSSDQAHPTGLDSSEFVVTKAQVNLHPTSLQSPEFENVIEQVSGLGNTNM